MTVYKFQLNENTKGPITITILKHTMKGIVLRQGDDKIVVSEENVEDFIRTLEDVKRWLNSI